MPTQTSSSKLGHDLPAVHTACSAIRSVLATAADRPERLKEVIDTTPEAMLAFDAQRRILHANNSAEALFGYARGALDSASLDLLVPEHLRKLHIATLEAVGSLTQVGLPGLRRDGTVLSIEWVWGLVVESEIFVMAFRDRTDIDRGFDELRESEERFRLLVEGVPEYAIFMLDPNGLVSSWNTGAERIKGWSASEIIGKSYEIFFTPEDRAAGMPERRLAAAVREGSQEVNGWRVRKDGTLFKASSYLTALRASTGELRGFAKITRDLTEKLQAEDLERRLAIERAGREAAEAAEQRVLASEKRLRRLQRVTAALSEAATPLEVASVVLDQVLEALDASSGSVFGVTADGRALELLAERGYPPNTLSKLTKVDLDFRVPLTDAARLRKAIFLESFEQGVKLYPELRKAILPGEFEAAVALPLSTRSELLGALGIRFDQARSFDENDRALLLTLSELCAQAFERAHLLAAERQARADAESANRAKDEFLAMLGHELRNPLAPIVTALSIMKDRDPGALQKERTVIERQVTHLSRLVDDLLDISRITRGVVELKHERIELGAVVTRAIELSRPMLEQRRQHLSLSVPEQGLTIHGDATRLSQVISNLLTNAAKYTPPGGRIEIAASRNEDRVVIQVRDNGIGIAPAMLPRVFDLFAQEHQGSDRSQGGLGLGLAIVKTLVAMHDGTVSAFSEGHDAGSTFTVELPAALPSSASNSANAAPKAARAQAAKRRVLVVDDNADSAEMLSEWLKGKGYDTRMAHDGPEALAEAARFAPDFVLLDIGLPIMDGFEVARRLRDQKGERPVPLLVAITGYGQPMDRERTRQEGFHAHLIKPVDLIAISDLLAKG